MSFEDRIANQMFAGNSERTYIDKLLGKDEITAIRNIIKKDDLDRQDMLELLDYLPGSEAKLLNFDDWDRYVLLKFYAWIRALVMCAEYFYDYEDKIIYQGEDGKYYHKGKEVNKEVFKIVISLRTEKTFNQGKKILSHAIKALVDLYLNIARTSLSVGGMGLLEFLKQRFELAYSNLPQLQTPNINNNSGIFGLGKGRGRA